LGTAGHKIGHNVPKLIGASEEIHQIGLVLIAQTDIETLIVEIQDVVERGRRAIVEVGRTRSESVKNRTLHFADIGTIAGAAREERSIIRSGRYARFSRAGDSGRQSANR
jgi:hypothetical protein